MTHMFSPPGDEGGEADSRPTRRLTSEYAAATAGTYSDQPGPNSRSDPARMDHLERAIRAVALDLGFIVDRFTVTEYRGTHDQPEVDITLKQVPRFVLDGARDGPL